MFFKPGDVVGGRFEVKKMLGRGGVGIVYLVHDNTRDEEVALKILKPELAGQKLALERFMREVQAVRNIDHEGTVPVYETGKLGESLFYTMERVKGRSIESIIKKEGRFDIDKAVSIMDAICDVMQKVHEVAVHRDISSDNIMIQEDGKVRILDFGTARITGQDSDLTRTSMHLGKVFYSAPEQRVNSKEVDHRADLYSLGVLLFEMLTGELVLGYEPVTEHRPEIPAEFNIFFAIVLAESPDERYENVGEFRAALNRLV